MSQEGPEIKTEARCSDCVFCRSIYFNVQGDSGHDVFCTHPEAEKFSHEEFRQREDWRGVFRGVYISSYSWKTPVWCPLLPLRMEAHAKALLREVEDATTDTDKKS